VGATSTDLLYGGGVGINVTESWQLRLEFDSLYIDGDWLGVESDTTIDSYAMGFQYRFGRRAADR
jgi:opacity protein-like surface antigen